MPRSVSSAPFRLWIRRTIRALIIVSALILIIGLYFWFSTPLPDATRLRERAALGNTRILDRTGKLLYEVPDPFSGRQQPIALTDIPLSLQQATIAVEDASFYDNPGVDWRGILRAFWDNLRSGEVVAGGSTITQQLARTFLLDPDLAQQQSIERKLRETVLALKLTSAYSKAEVLTLYLNQVYYGRLNYGVEAAAQSYFGKPARELDLAESAFLAGLPQAPSRYDPFSNRAIALARQQQVLDAMARNGSLTQPEAARAKLEILQFSGNALAMRAPHFVTYVLDTLTAELGPDTVLRGGLTITTTLDADLQDAAQTILTRQIQTLSTPRDGHPDHRVRNGAVIVLAPSDGAILAMVGSPDFANTTIQGQVNGTLALRQPGSAIKPLTYAAALERGWTPATMLLDVPSSFPTREGPPYTPENYDRAYHGPLSLREALATSSNIAAVRTLQHIGVPALLNIAARLGIVSFTHDSARFGLALTLGGGELTPLELTSAYAAFANGGFRVTPYAIENITFKQSSEQRAISTLQRPNAPTPQPAIAPEIAYLISDILSDPYARLRAFGENSPLDLDRPAAAKTGTTSDWRDNWTVGYTPDRVVGVWVGNADGEPMRNITGISGAGPVWHDVMLAAHRNLPPRPFARPSGIVEASICSDSGLLPSPNCPATRLERFMAGTIPTQADNTHIVLDVDFMDGCRAPSGYPAARRVKRVFRLFPPEAEAWAIAAGMPDLPKTQCAMPANTKHDQSIDQPAQTSSAQLLSQQQASFTTGKPSMLVPAAGTIFRLSPGLPAERQQVMLQAQATQDAAEVAIIVDGTTVARFQAAPFRTLWQLRPGEHRAWVEVRDRQGHVQRSTETMFSVGP